MFFLIFIFVLFLLVWKIKYLFNLNVDWFVVIFCVIFDCVLGWCWVIWWLGSVIIRNVMEKCFKMDIKDVWKIGFFI